MLNLIQNDESPASWISPHFFDVVIADESHRSIYNVYQQVLGYFHAIKIGLTATPTDRIDHDTFELFDCETYDPTFAYTFEEAVAHVPPYLCDFEVLKVRSKFQLEGIQGGLSLPQVQSRLIAEGKDLEDIDFEGTDLEHKVTNSGTNALIVREFMEECIKDPSGDAPRARPSSSPSPRGTPGGSQELFDELYPEHAGRLARVLVSDDRCVYGKGGLLDQFKTPGHAARRDLGRPARHRRGRPRGREPRVRQARVLLRQVLADDRPRDARARGRSREAQALVPGEGPIPDHRLLGQLRVLQDEPQGSGASDSKCRCPVRLFRARLDKLEAASAVGVEP